MLTLFIAAAAASAQPPSETITVTGRKLEEAKREAREFVRALGVAEQPVARWVNPICPKVLGVAKPVADRVVRKVREVASLTRVSVAPAGCRANIFITFTGDANAVVRQIAARAPARFGDLPGTKRQELAEGYAPVRWWHQTESRTGDGTRSVGNDAPPSSGVATGPFAPPIAGEIFSQYNSSLVSTKMARVLRSATILIDVNKATGANLDSVAALAALVGLAEIDPSTAPPSGSILNMFQADGPKELTALDANFLTALYKLPLDRTAMAHRGLLVRGLTSGAAE
jgi:hypothetical protein